MPTSRRTLLLRSPRAGHLGAPPRAARLDLSVPMAGARTDLRGQATRRVDPVELCFLRSASAGRAASFTTDTGIFRSPRCIAREARKPKEGSGGRAWQRARSLRIPSRIKTLRSSALVADLEAISLAFGRKPEVGGCVERILSVRCATARGDDPWGRGHFGGPTPWPRFHLEVEACDARGALGASPDALVQHCKPRGSVACNDFLPLRNQGGYGCGGGKTFGGWFERDLEPHTAGMPAGSRCWMV